MFNHISNTQLSSLPYTRNGSMNDSSDEDEGVGITFSWMGSGRLDNYPICDQDERVILDTKINFFTIRFIDNNDSLFIKPKFYQNCNEFKNILFTESKITKKANYLIKYSTLRKKCAPTTIRCFYPSSCRPFRNLSTSV